MKAYLDHTELEADTIISYYFKPEKSIDYTAGQFIELVIPHEADSRGDRRWFTLSSSPTQELVSITTKHANDSGSSYKRALAALQKGDSVMVSDPMGDFVLPKLVQTPILFIAGGIGVTPMHSMLSWLADTRESRPISMLYGVPNEEEIIFQPTFDRAKQHVTISVEHPSAAWGGERGNITAEKVLGLEKPSVDTLIYISGPEPMVEKLEKDLVKAGIKHAQLVLDFFPNYQQI